MKYTMRWYICIGVMLVGAIDASVPGIPTDMLGPTSSENTLRNKIFSTVQNNPDGLPKYHFEPPNFERKTEGPARNNITANVAKSAPAKTEYIKDTDNTQFLSSVDNHVSEHPILNKKDVVVEGVTQYTDSSAQAVPDVKKHEDTNDKQEDHVTTVESKKVHDTVNKAVEPKEQGVLYQQPGFVDDHETVSFNFEATDLANVASYMETIHNIKFISEDVVSTTKDAKGLSGHKITFRTNKILSKKESWDLFITFLHIAGLDVVPMAQAGFYRIVPFAKANTESLPSYIGVSSDLLPDNDMVIRYVYFANNINPENVSKILVKMQGGSAKIDTFSQLKALIFTDRARNIKSLMQIVKELDQAVLPEALSVVKLKKANVDDVIKLYKSLKSSGSAQQPQRAWSKEPSLEYFPSDVTTIPDTRTNSLILLGPAKGIKRIEEFIEKHIDVDVDQDAPPVFTYQLQYTKAATIQPILDKIVKYGPSGATGSSPQGTVRDGVQYFNNMTIVAEPHSNKLIINATKDDYEALKPLIDELDTPQKQIGLEVLIVQVSDVDTKTLGAQVSMPGGVDQSDPTNSKCQTFMHSAAAQTSGILNSTTGEGTTHVVSHNSTTLENSIKTGLSKLLGTSVVNEAGSILLTFGQPIWAIFKVLKKVTSTHVVANPFVVVTNNSPANVSIGEERRVVSSETATTSGDNSIRGLTPSTAALGFEITPQINKGNIVNMSIKVENNQFTGEGENNALQSKKVIQTYASVANGEVLVLGGIMTEKTNVISRGVPFLEHVPIVGWLFKSKAKTATKDHFLIFISPKLLDPMNDQKEVDNYTQYKMEEANKNMQLIEDFNWFSEKRDPIQRKFFDYKPVSSLQDVTSKIKQGSATRKERKKKNKKPKKQEPEISLDKDFLSTESQPTQVKNSIFNSMNPRKKHA